MGLGTDKNGRGCRTLNAFLNIEHINYVSEAQYDHRSGPGRHWMGYEALRDPHLTLHIASNELVEARRRR